MAASYAADVIVALEMTVADPTLWGSLRLLRLRVWHQSSKYDFGILLQETPSTRLAAQ